MASRKMPAAPSFGRERATKEQLRKIYIFCEGQITEPNYLECLYREVGRGAFTMDLSRGCGSPVTIVTKCKDKKYALHRTKNFMPGDQVWAVFDVDEHPNIEEAVSHAYAAGVCVAVSNPCIEIWGIFHHKPYNSPLTHRQAQTKLAKIKPPYHHERHPVFDWPLYKDNIELAISNAISANKAREVEGSKFPRNVPSTTFYCLIQAMQRGLK